MENNTTELAVIEQSYNLPTTKQINEYSKFLKAYDRFIDGQLNQDIDYGIIPGVEKPSLLKPGAEKLEKLFFLTHKKECVDKIVRDDYISYSYRTTIFDKNGNVKATCEGTCNSKEKKYRYITVFDNQATDEDKKDGRLETRRSKAGKEYRVYVVEKKDYYDIENTIMKMAQKRSYVGAILEATNSSGRFTQDVEDMDIINVEDIKDQLKTETVKNEKSFLDMPADTQFKHTCPTCGKSHNGQYPKCLDCYRAGQKK